MKINYFLFSIMCVLSLSCSQEKESTEEETNEESASDVSLNNNVADVKWSKEPITSADSIYIISIIKELKGIEKFAVKDNFSLLYSLLDFKGDSRYEKVKAILNKEYEYMLSHGFYIEVLDIKNGYMKYSHKQADASRTITFWNLDDGSKLIAYNNFENLMVISSSLSFQKFKDGTYQSIPIVEIIPEMNKLEKMYEEFVASFPSDASEMFDLYYELPQKGKNIQYCINRDCIILQWNNGIFEIKEE